MLFISRVYRRSSCTFFVFAVSICRRSALQQATSGLLSDSQPYRCAASSQIRVVKLRCNWRVRTRIPKMTSAYWIIFPMLRAIGVVVFVAVVVGGCSCCCGVDAPLVGCVSVCTIYGSTSVSACADVRLCACSCENPVGKLRTMSSTWARLYQLYRYIRCSQNPCHDMCTRRQYANVHTAWPSPAQSIPLRKHKRMRVRMRARTNPICFSIVLVRPSARPSEPTNRPTLRTRHSICVPRCAIGPPNRHSATPPIVCTRKTVSAPNGTTFARALSHK